MLIDHPLLPVFSRLGITPFCHERSSIVSQIRLLSHIAGSSLSSDRRGRTSLTSTTPPFRPYHLARLWTGLAFCSRTYGYACGRTSSEAAQTLFLGSTFPGPFVYRCREVHTTSWTIWGCATGPDLRCTKHARGYTRSHTSPEMVQTLS